MTLHTSFAELMARLRADGVATDADAEAVRVALSASLDDDMPMYLRVLVGLGAWVATILLIGFFFALRLLDDRNAALAFGAVLIAGATWFRRRAGGDFTRNAAVAASFAGQGVIVIALGNHFSSDAPPFIAAALLSAVMFVLMPDVLHRFLSALICVGATATALVILRASHALDITALSTVVVSAWVWRGDVKRRSDELYEMLVPVGYGLAVGLFGLCLFGAFFAVVGGNSHAPAFGVITTDGVAVALSALVLVILREHETSPSGVAGLTILVVIAVFAMLTAKSPGIIIGVAMLLLGFDRKNLILIELATAFLVVFGFLKQRRDLG